MAKRQPDQTLSDLLADVIAERRLTVWCEEAGVRAQTVRRLLDGTTPAPQRSTVLAIAKALGRPDAEVRAAIAASRAAAGKD